MIGKTIAEVFAINSENEIVSAKQPEIVIPYDVYTDLCNFLGRWATPEEQRSHYGAEHAISD